ncbi:MAG: tRNA 2-thiocytidine(32) synthetase TtcA [Deltaproteobacteria bacterium]|nr:tRNA 2-thiocytidine(32) synthetase TtcA [Deltaproteobacteria bacterium]
MKPTGSSPGRATGRISDLEHMIMCRVGHAIGDYDLIEPDDRIAVAVSGGAKSFTLLHMLDLHRRRYKFSFDLIPVFFDRGWNPSAADRLTNEFAKHGFEVRIVFDDIRIKLNSGDPLEKVCSKCCRITKGVIHQFAQEHKCNKIAFGQLLDDFIETLFLNLFFSGQLKSNAVRLSAKGQAGTEIRPLVNVEYDYIAKFVQECTFEPIDIGCPYKDSDDSQHRKAVKNMVKSMSGQYPRVRRSLLAAMKHLRPTHLLDSGFG